jgi:hypothetical protein
MTPPVLREPVTFRSITSFTRRAFLDAGEGGHASHKRFSMNCVPCGSRQPRRNARRFSRRLGRIG